MSILSKLLRSSLELKNRAQNYKGKVFQKPKKGTVEDKQYKSIMSMNIRAKEQLQAMRKNITQNTPKICAGIILFSSLPQCYFYYQAMWCDYHDRKYMENIKKTMDWINYKGAFFTAVLFGLQAVDYKDFKAKNVLQQRSKSLYLLLIPIALNLISISFLHYYDKKVMLGSLSADFSLLILEAKLSNEAVIPFYYFNLRYQQHLFDILMLSAIYFSLKHFNVDLESNKARYYLEQDQNQEKEDSQLNIQVQI